MRIRPVEVAIPSTPSELFQNDLLDRKEPIEVLTAAISSIEGPCVVAVDAEWGAGKTTFLRLWAQYLRNKKYQVVEYNAWKTDFANHPFAALFHEMTSALPSNKEQVIEEFKNIGKDLARSFVEHHLGRVGLDQIMKCGPRPLEEYRQTKDLLTKFRTALQNTASGLGDNPLVVFIDELDRCRPLYAIELLEVAKHLFSVDGVVFVFGVNQEQLKHSVSVVYGTDFDSADYLRRFFDWEFVLPASDRKVFIDRQLSNTRLNAYFASKNDQVLCANAWLRSYLSSHDISIRTVAQFVHRAGLALATLPSDMGRFQWATVVALIIKTTDPGVYRRLLTGTISDDDAYQRLSVHSSITALPHPRRFEAAIIMACHEMADTGPGDESIEQPLLQKHRKRCETVDASKEYRAAKGICKLVDAFNRLTQAGEEGFSFRHAIRRIEMTSAEHSGLLQRQLAESRNP